MPEESAFFWARYENTQGRTWENGRLPDRSKNLKIKRVRLVWLREWLEELKRRRFRKKALGKEQKMIAEFRAMGDE